MLARARAGTVMTAARAGDESAFAALVEPHRRELHVHCYEGKAAILPLLQHGLSAPGDRRLVPAMANRMPTAASYLRAPGDSEFRAFKLDVLRIEDGLIAEITTFDASLFAAFGLPPTL